MKRWISWGVAAWMLSAAVAAAPAQPEASFPLEPYRKGVALRVEVAGHPTLFTFDSAGGLSMLSPDFARKIGCAPWGRLSGHMMMGDRLDTPRCDDVAIRIGGSGFRAPVMAVLDIAPLIAKDAEPVDGVIALDLFAGKAITIDLRDMRLVVESPQSLDERVRGAKPLPVLLSRELQGRALAASVGVPTAKGMVWMELDTGNGGTLLVSKPYAELFGLDPKAEGMQQADFAVSPDLRAQGNAFAPDMILDGNLGMPFLRGKVITLDLAAGRLWISAPAPK